MKTVDELRGILADLEKIAERIGVDEWELESHAERLAKQARIMDYSDVSDSVSLLLAALLIEARSALATRPFCPDP